MYTEILGVKITNLNYLEIQQLLLDIIINPLVSHNTVIFTPNPEILVYTEKNPSFKKLLNSADLLLPDGQGLILASRGKIKKRITGVDTMFFLLEQANQHKLTVGFVIDNNGLSTFNDINIIMRKRFPNCSVIVIDSADTITQSYKQIPDIIFVGLGFPKQENWIQFYRTQFVKTKIIMAVGGGIDFLTQKQARAPLLFRQNGLEWLYRLFNQPKRLKRIINAVIVFPYCLFKRNLFKHDY